MDRDDKTKSSDSAQKLKEEIGEAKSISENEPQPAELMPYLVPIDEEIPYNWYSAYLEPVIVERDDGNEYFLVGPDLLFFRFNIQPFFRKFYDKIDIQLDKNLEVVIDDLEERINNAFLSFKNDSRVKHICNDVNELKPKFSEEEFLALRQYSVRIGNLPKVDPQDIEFLKACLNEVSTIPNNKDFEPLSSDKKSKFASILEPLTQSADLKKFVFDLDYNIEISLRPPEGHGDKATHTFANIHATCADMRPKMLGYIFSKIHWVEHRFQFDRVKFKNMFEGKLLELPTEKEREVRDLKVKRIQLKMRKNENYEEKLEEINKRIASLEAEIKVKKREYNNHRYFWGMCFENMILHELRKFEKEAKMDVQIFLDPPLKVFAIDLEPVVMSNKRFLDLARDTTDREPGMLYGLHNMLKSDFQVGFHSTTQDLDAWFKSIGLEMPSIFIDSYKNEVIKKPVYFRNEFIDASTFEKLKKEHKEKKATDSKKTYNKHNNDDSQNYNDCFKINKKYRNYRNKIAFFKNAKKEMKNILGPFYKYLTKNTTDSSAYDLDPTKIDLSAYVY